MTATASTQFTTARVRQQQQHHPFPSVDGETVPGVKKNKGCVATTCDDHEAIRCDACPNCSDVCSNYPHCPSCAGKQQQPTCYYTLCQVRRHNHHDSAWLVAGSSIYDATSYVQCHPAGESTILLKAGGQKDVTRDIQFHSARTRKMMDQSLRVGKLVPCGEQQQRQQHEWWKFW